MPNILWGLSITWRQLIFFIDQLLSKLKLASSYNFFSSYLVPKYLNLLVDYEVITMVMCV